MSSTAVAAKVAKVPPSSFSVLLRRSKFASYDPKIGQVYATYDGSAARGDWGVKRPLAVRRRDGKLLIHKMDTLYQQTEWTSVYTDVTALRKIEELPNMPKVAAEGSTWAPRVNINTYHRDRYLLRDSDYFELPPSKVEKDLEDLTPVPDPGAMKPKRLERYLRKVRRLLPEFEEFVVSEKKKRQTDFDGTLTNAKNLPLHVLAKRGSRQHIWFLSDKFAELCKSENSTIIRPMPHATAGLKYAYSNELQDAVMGEPLPGRRLHYGKQQGIQGIDSISVVVSFAGWTTEEQVSVRKDDERAVMTDFGTEEEPRQDLEAGKQNYKPMSLDLVSPPEVVGEHPQRMDESWLRMTVGSWAGAEKSRPNPYKPGTVEYIAHKEGQQDPSRRTSGPVYKRPPSNFTMTGRRRKLPTSETPARPKQSEDLIKSLRSIVDNKQKQKGGNGAKEGE